MTPAIQILLAVAAIIVVFLVVVATRPSQFTVTRRATIAAPPSAIFPQVNNFLAWEAWSPWEKRDPDMKKTYEGPSGDIGAVYAWSGNKDVGQGSMTLTESRPSDLIRIRLNFVKPFACTNDVVFTFEPRGNQTDVTWSMSGRNNFMAKAVGLFMNMDKMIGGDFEEGLANLKTTVETPTGQASVYSN